MKRKLRIGSKEFDLDKSPLVMGVLNITPDSFSDGGKYVDTGVALSFALEMVRDGADIIDIGGESTRPGSGGIGDQEELDRVIPVIAALRKESDTIISIDTTKAIVFSEAIAAGADMLNDISGLKRDHDMLKLLQRNKLPVIIMHSKGRPDVMQKNPSYDDLIAEIAGFLKRQADLASAAGSQAVFIDPGIGFGKTAEHNLQLIKHLDRFRQLGYAVAVGPSRKSFIGKTLGLKVDERLEATLSAAAISVFNGADLVRVHDVKEARRAVDLASKIRSA